MTAQPEPAVPYPLDLCSGAEYLGGVLDAVGSTM